MAFEFAGAQADIKRGRKVEKDLEWDFGEVRIKTESSDDVSAYVPDLIDPAYTPRLLVAGFIPEECRKRREEPEGVLIQLLQAGGDFGVGILTQAATL